MGFADWGKSKEEIEQSEREHKEKRARLQKESYARIRKINQEIIASNRAHAKYQHWLWETGRTDISFEDWQAGRYIHVVLTTDN